MKKQKIKFFAASKNFELIDNPILPSYNEVPKWWKEMSPTTDLEPVVYKSRFSSTVKRCVPFLDALTTGYMIYMPCDVEIKKIDGVTHAIWNVNEQIMDKDNISRHAGLPVPEGHSNEIWRVSAPSVIATPKGHSILITHPFNRFDLPFTVLSGVIDSDKLQGPMSINIHLKYNFEGIIEKNTPLAQVFPFARIEWEHEVLPVNQELILKNDWKINSTLQRAYQKLFWQKKNYK